MNERLTRSRLIQMMGVGPNEKGVSDAVVERAAFVAGFASPQIGTTLFDALDGTPYDDARRAAEKARFEPDRDAHRERLRSLKDLPLALYLAEAIRHGARPSFGPAWQVAWEPGLPPKGSRLFYAILEVGIPGQSNPDGQGGKVYLHLTDQLEVVDAILNIRYLGWENGRTWETSHELRQLGREFGTAMWNVAQHYFAERIGPDFLQEHFLQQVEWAKDSVPTQGEST